MSPYRRHRCALTLALTCLFAGCRGEQAAPDSDAATDAPVAKASLGPVSAEVFMTPAKPRFGERVRFRLEVACKPGAELQPLEVPKRLGHFRVRGHEVAGTAASGRLTFRITAEAEKTGVNLCRLPRIPFHVKTGEGAGTDQELALETFEVEVAGLTPDQQPDLADLGTPLPPVSLPVDRVAGRGLWITLAAVLVALVVAFVWWRRRRRGEDRAEPEIEPGEEAAAAFAALLALDLPARGRFAEFYVQLTGIVRRYIERTTGIHAPEETTDEFLREMEAHPAFDGEQRRRLRTFLEASDLVKFAAQVPDEAEIAGAVDRAKSFCGLGAEPAEVAA